MTIAVSVIVAVRNEAPRIGRCLAALSGFDEIVVVDSDSDDGTRSLAEQSGATVVSFQWNGAYPKKRQWCLDHLDLRHDWVFFVDADEIVPGMLVDEIRALFERGPGCEGYFVRGFYIMDGKTLLRGLSNNKLVLFDRRRLEFPVVDDLGLPGMGEMEGHYQPVAKKGKMVSIGQLRAGLLHEAYGTREEWERRHRRYAAWEAGMNARHAWPEDPVRLRQRLKTLFRAMPCRPLAAFCHCYFYKGGILEGRQGWTLAADRYRYYRMVRHEGRLVKYSRRP